MKEIISKRTVVYSLLCLLLPLSFVNAEDGKSCSTVLVSKKVERQLAEIDAENRLREERSLKDEHPTLISVLPGVREGERKPVQAPSKKKVLRVLKQQQKLGAKRTVYDYKTLFG